MPLLIKETKLLFIGIRARYHSDLNTRLRAVEALKQLRGSENAAIANRAYMALGPDEN